MTYAEQTVKTGERDDKHMIYEMMNISQYEDGSVLECIDMNTYTAQQIASGTQVKYNGAGSPRTINADLKRNALAALKHGTTNNRAPRV
jgi:hypothetical protein